jgi:hypothetical protein
MALFSASNWATKSSDINPHPTLPLSSQKQNDSTDGKMMAGFLVLGIHMQGFA